MSFGTKELSTFFPNEGDSKEGGRFGDKLIKGYLKDGSQHAFLIHIEIQDYEDTDFAWRMFQCAYRLKERYGLPLTALVIYTDPPGSHHVKEYHEDFLGCKLSYTFNVYELATDYKEGEWQSNDNVFSIILETTRHYLIRDQLTDADLAELKFRLIKRMYEMGVSKGDIERLISFIRNYIRIKDERASAQLEENIKEFTNETETMGLHEAMLQEAKDIGLKEGLEKGEEKGMGKGMEQGMKKAQLNTTQNLLRSKLFASGQIAYQDIANLTGLSVEDVQKVHKDIFSN